MSYTKRSQRIIDALEYHQEQINGLLSKFTDNEGRRPTDEEMRLIRLVQFSQVQSDLVAVLTHWTITGSEDHLSDACTFIEQLIGQ